MSKVAVIGLDGGTWDLMMPLAAEGFLPNLSALVQEACWCELDSTIPPVTAPAWATFATGKNPGKTGVFDFLVPRNSLTNLSPVTSRDICGKTFYEVIDGYGMSTVMINLPLSYPPRTNNPTITCMLTQGGQFIFPPGLAQLIPEFADYRLVPEFSLRAQGRLEEYAQDIRKLEQVRFICAQKFFQTDWDFFFLLFSGTDWIQHDLYDSMLSDVIPREHAAFQLLRDIDSYMGWFVEHLPRETYLLLMSDHGFRCYRGVFLLNQWLKEQHLLRSRFVKRRTRAYSHLMEKGMAEALANEASKRNRIPAALASIRMALAEETEHLRSGAWRELAQGLDPTRLGKKIAVDYSKSVAACTSPQLSGIYLNSAARFENGIVHDQDVKSIKDQIISRLRGLRDPVTGGGAFAGVLDNSEAYFGDRSYLGPDIVISPDSWLVVSVVAHRNRMNLFTGRTINSHSRMGMFLGYGPGVKRNHRLQEARIEDIAPTILHLLGLPCPSDLDGRILMDLFDAPLPQQAAPPRPMRVNEERRIGRVIERLKDSRGI